MIDLKKIATLVAQRRQQNKETLSKVASLIAQKRQQSLIKEAGMQKTALIGKGQLSNILNKLGDSGVYKHVFRGPNELPSNNNLKNYIESLKDWRANSSNIPYLRGNDALLQQLARKETVSKYIQSLKDRLHAADIRRMALDYHNTEIALSNSLSALPNVSVKSEGLLKRIADWYNSINETPITKLLRKD